MSAATEITRIQQAKADIKTAIQAKGVTVPSNALISTYATYVNNIPAYATDLKNLVQRTGTTINLPNDTSQIGYKAFSGCSSLTSIDLPATIDHIDHSAFENCVALASVGLDAGNYAFRYINNCAFDSCLALTSIKIPFSCFAIGTSAFRGCNSLTDVEMYPITLPSVDGASATKSFPSGATITVAPGLLDTYRHGTYWSNYYSQLTEFSGVTIVCERTSNAPTILYNTTDITRMIVQDVGDVTVSDTVTLSSNYREMFNTIVVYGNAPTAIPDQQFMGRFMLRDFYISQDITEIGFEAFKNCAYLGYQADSNDPVPVINIPDNITTIDEGAFYGCSNMQILHIGSGITSIGDYAFYGCMSLGTILIDATTPPTLGTDAMKTFYSGTTTVYVPDAYVNDYQNDQYWGNLGFSFLPMTDYPS